jgi:hypothetical protein
LESKVVIELLQKADDDIGSAKGCKALGYRFYVDYLVPPNRQDTSVKYEMSVRPVWTLPKLASKSTQEAPEGIRRAAFVIILTENSSRQPCIVFVDTPYLFGVESILPHREVMVRQTVHFSLEDKIEPYVG